MILLYKMLIEKKMTTKITDALLHLWTSMKIDLYKLFIIIDDDTLVVVPDDEDYSYL